MEKYNGKISPGKFLYLTGRFAGTGLPERLFTFAFTLMHPLFFYLKMEEGYVASHP
jgi:hypothetical protein